MSLRLAVTEQRHAPGAKGQRQVTVGRAYCHVVDRPQWPASLNVHARAKEDDHGAACQHDPKNVACPGLAKRVTDQPAPRINDFRGTHARGLDLSSVFFLAAEGN